MQRSSMDKNNPTYILPYREKRRLCDRAYRAQQRDQSEVCGLLIADSKRRIALHFVKNDSGVPGKYKIAKDEIQAVRKNAILHKKRVLGSFHSHPISEAIPGRGDVTGGFYAGVEMIYDVCGREVKLWRIQRRGLKREIRELPLVIESRSTH